MHIVIVALLIWPMIAMSAAEDTDAREKEACMQPVIEVFDETTGRRLPYSHANELGDRRFGRFVASLASQFNDHYQKQESCTKPTAGKSSARLVLVYRPLLGKAGALPIQSATDGTRSSLDATCRLRSPWINMWTTGPAHDDLQAEIFWSERQMLFDQALLAAGNAEQAMQLAASVPMPLPALEPAAFTRYVQDYEKSVLRAATPHARAAAQARMPERLPPDILWLLRHAWQSTLAPFPMAVGKALDDTIQRVAPHYTDLVATLAAHCLATTESGNYRNILELNFISNEYRIDRLH